MADAVGSTTRKRKNCEDTESGGPRPAPRTDCAFEAPPITTRISCRKPGGALVQCDCISHHLDGCDDANSVVQKALQVPELLVMIFHCLDAEERIGLSRVSSFWRDLMTSPVVQRIGRFRLDAVRDKTNIRGHEKLLASVFAARVLDTLVVDLKMGSLYHCDHILVHEINFKTSPLRRLIFTGGTVDTFEIEKIRLFAAPLLIFHKVNLNFCLGDLTPFEIEEELAPYSLYLENSKLRFAPRPDHLKEIYKESWITRQLLDYCLKLLVVDPVPEEEVRRLRRLLSAGSPEFYPWHQRHNTVDQILLRYDPKRRRPVPDYRDIQLSELRPIAVVVLNEVRKIDRWTWGHDSDLSGSEDNEEDSDMEEAGDD